MEDHSIRISEWKGAQTGISSWEGGLLHKPLCACEEENGNHLNETFCLDGNVQ